MPLDAPKLISGELIEPGDRSVHVIACPHPFRVERTEHHLDAGLTLAEILTEVQPLARLRRYARIWIGDHNIAPGLWHCVRPKPGARVYVRIVPAGGGEGKNPLAIVLSIAVLAFAFVLPQLLFTKAFLQTAVIGSLTVGNLLTAGIGLAGTLLVNALVKPSLPKQDKLAAREFDTSPSISGARNQARPNAPIPWVLGRVRSYPPLGALSFTEVVGNDQFVRVLVIWGYGPLNITDIKIGETAIANFEDVLIETRQGFPADPPLSLFSETVFEEPLTVTLTAEASWQVRTTQAETDEVSVDIGFLQGLARIDDEGKSRSLSVTVEVESSPAGTNTWTPRGTFVVEGREFKVIRRNLRVAVPRGQYDIRLRRTTPDRSASASEAIADSVTWTTLRSIKNEDPIQIAKPLAKTSFRIKATDQLQNEIDEINAVVESIVLDWDAAGGAWVERFTTNPASLYRHVLQGPGNAKAVSDGELDLTTIQAWHEKNAAKGYAFNLIVDFRTTAEELLLDIASAGRARKVMPDGRYSVVLDDLKPAISQHFTPRNSWGFSTEVSFKDELPHGLRVPFMNEDASYLEDQRIVYRDGFDVFNATKIEKLEMRGITAPELIWKHSRYHLAQAEYRPDGYSFFADIEHLLCNVGDRIELNHDVVSAGLGNGRVKAVLDDGGAPPNATAVQLDQNVEMEASKSYGLRFRKAGGTSLVKTVATAEGEQSEVSFITPFPLTEAPEPGDLFLFGEAGKESQSLFIVGIERAEDLTAKVRCVDYAPQIQTADDGPVPPHQSSVVSPSLLPQPIILDVRSDDTAMVQGPDGSWSGRIIATVEIPSDLDPLVIGIEAHFRLQGASGTWSRTPIQNLSDNEVILEPVEDKETYELRLRYVRNTLRPGPWSDLLVHTVQGKLRRPPNVTSFSAQQNGSVVVMSWDIATGNDIDGYDIRRAELDNIVDWSDAEIVTRVTRGTQLTTAAVPPGAHRLMIKAFDGPGNESLDPAIADIVVTNPNDIVLDATQTARWPGTLNGFLKHNVSGRLVPDSRQPARLHTNAQLFEQCVPFPVAMSTYETKELDLGFDATSVRVFGSLAARLCGGGGIADPKLELDYRPSGGVFDGFEPWAIGVIDLRFARARVIIDHSTGTGLLEGMRLFFDVPERIEQAKNIAVPVGGLSIIFAERFHTVPTIQVQAKPEAGALRIASYDAETVAGFEVRIYDPAGTETGGTLQFWRATGG